MAAPSHFLGSMTLKALLEDPILKNPPVIGITDDPQKLKKEDDLPLFNYGSAFLGPNLWDNTIDNFNLEYMDLDEFLSENGIPVAGDEGIKGTNKGDDLPSKVAVSSTPSQPPSPRQYLNTPPMSPSQFLKIPPPSQHYPPISSPTAASSSKSPSPPVSPFNVEFQVSQQDLALTSIPDYGEDSTPYVPKWKVWTEENRKKNGSEEFDPRRRNFTEEELKPQPIIKKSKKVFVPEDLKDDRYWARRNKNNYAAKRSRDARRVKENQIALRAAFLEKENSCLREEMNKLRKENAKLKVRLSKYEGTSSDEAVTQ
ncbi:thyrotroph embryonic factor-like isoform X1 [Biomphalaria pfeifferi]|uniref:Thyrotroph embryonic factor-like isoform X1 n=1 Tax=Biomphalaria pfeifferi TaxID=112525 RepID=A0AAD8BU21_BIOPF|nr:thyrotroph embryonic factor-like isoform X1 [Biomphalaria pfeifferi]